MRTLARLILTARYLVVGLLTLGCGTAGLEPGSADWGSADMVLLHGKILTVDDQLPEVQALAAQGERILAVASSADLRISSMGVTLNPTVLGRSL